MIEVRTQIAGRLTELERELTVPVRAIGEWLAQAIATRMQKGIGPFGPTKPYAGTDGRVWVPPRGLQPDGDKYRVTEGPWRGWAIYPDWDTYRGLTGRGKHREYKATGHLWERALTVYQMSPRHVRIHFTGKHPSGKKPADIARLASRDEPGGLLTPSQSELATVQQMAEGALSEQLLGAIGSAEASFQARKTLSGLQRTVSKLLSPAARLR
jgi:hypothetical protein